MNSKIKWGILLLLAGAAAAALIWLRPLNPPAALQPNPSETSPAPGLQLTTLPDGRILETTTDAPEIFRRAFWRHPTNEDAILQAERRHWIDSQGLTKWQWFLALRPAPATRQWLEQNPFAFSPLNASPVTIPPELSAPAWFPGSVETGRAWQKGNTGFLLFEKSTGILYATDQGAGHSPPAQP